MKAHDKQKRMRIYFTGVGGQGTLTATTLLARTALQAGLDVVAGEVHGMAQRGGVVESVLLLGGWLTFHYAAVYGAAAVSWTAFFTTSILWLLPTLMTTKGRARMADAGI